MIYLQAGRQDFDEDGKKSVLNFKAGEMKWSPAGGMHIAEVTSNTSVNIIEVELKKPGTGAPASTSALDPVKVDKKHYKVELENGQVRVLRVKIGPHQSTPLHEAFAQSRGDIHHRPGFSRYDRRQRGNGETQSR
jgi:hypothetical protein